MASRKEIKELRPDGGVKTIEELAHMLGYTDGSFTLESFFTDNPDHVQAVVDSVLKNDVDREGKHLTKMFLVTTKYIELKTYEVEASDEEDAEKVWEDIPDANKEDYIVKDGAGTEFESEEVEEVEEVEEDCSAND